MPCLICLARLANQRDGLKQECEDDLFCLEYVLSSTYSMFGAPADAYVEEFCVGPLPVSEKTTYKSADYFSTKGSALPHGSSTCLTRSF